MAKGNISTVGIDGGNQPRRVAASATRFYAGEPLNNLATLSSGAASVNTVVVLTDAKPRIATDNFQGIASTDAPVNTSGTVIAGKVYVTVPIPYITRIRGNAKTTSGLVDTDANLINILGDAVDFDLTNSVYTIDGTAASNASGLTIVDGNIIKGQLDVVVDARAMRVTIS
jgi:hypothetical protein